MKAAAKAIFCQLCILLAFSDCAALAQSAPRSRARPEPLTDSPPAVKATENVKLPDQTNQVAPVSPATPDSFAGDNAQLGMALLGAELLTTEKVWQGVKYLELRIGKMHPSGPAAMAGIYTGEKINRISTPYSAEPKSAAELGALLKTNTPGTPVIFETQFDNSPFLDERTYAVVTMDRPLDTSLFIERLRPKGVPARSSKHAASLYASKLEAFLASHPGAATVTENEPAPPTRGSINGKTRLTDLADAHHSRPFLSLFYDEELLKSDLLPGEIDLYILSERTPAPPTSELLSSQNLGTIKFFLRDIGRSAKVINFFLATTAEGVYAKYQIVPEGRPTGEAHPFIDAGSDSSWVLDDPKLRDYQRTSVTKYEFDRSSYFYGRTIQNILDRQFDLIRGNLVITYHMSGLFANYALLYGSSDCVKDAMTIEVIRSKIRDSDQSVLSSTRHEILVAPRHKQKTEEIVYAVYNVSSIVNTALRADMVKFFQSYPCSNEIHAVFEKNLLEFISTKK